MVLSGPAVAISAGTPAEVPVLAARHGVGAETVLLVQGLQWDAVSVDHRAARRVVDACNRGGRLIQGARLNLGDGFACEFASRLRCALLFACNDFSKTDLVSALSGRP